MCGIAGLLSFQGTPDLGEVAAAMAARLARRGPDGEGIHAEPGLALAHRRLAILDLSERGHQPMANEDGTLWLTFNGEIYNFRSLRRDLEARGHRFASDTDSEVLLHLYEEADGDPQKLLEPVRGMFAFALWDHPRRRLLLARDRLGIKPLVYWAGPEGLAFASDLEALGPWVPRELDWTSLFEYLVLLTVPGPQTIWRGVRTLPPGSFALVENGQIREAPYWQLPTETAEDSALEEVLSEAVDLHLVSDVEVGAFLSGGIDSGLVTALAAERMSHPLRTFTATFPGEAVDEGLWARQAAERLHVGHEAFALQGGMLDGLEDAVAAMDQPLALTSALALFHLSRLARQRLKVVLTGDGGDEVFAGYSRHRPDVPPPGIAAHLPPAWRRRLGRGLRKVSGNGRLGALASALARDETDLYVPRLYAMTPEAALALLPEEIRLGIDTRRYLERVRRLFGEAPRLDPLTRRLRVDLQTSLVDEMLAKVDRMTMAWGLEARVPLLDHRVVEVGMRMPGALKRRNGTGKLPLRHMVAARLGPETAERGKQGFNSPLDRWLTADPATREAFEALWPAVERCGLFAPGEPARWKARYGSEGGPTSNNLFALLVAGLWAGRR